MYFATFLSLTLGSLVVDFDNVHHTCLDEVIGEIYEPDETISFINANNITRFYKSHIFAPTSNPLVVVNIYNNGNLRSFDEYSYVNYVIFASNLEELQHDLLKAKESSMWNRNTSPRGKFLVVTSEKLHHVESFFKYLWSEDVYRLIVMQSEEGNVEESLFLSADPYNLTNYQNMSLDVLGSCRNRSRITFLNYSPEGQSLNLTFCCYSYDLPKMGLLDSGTPGTSISTLKLISRKLGMHLVINTDEDAHNEYSLTGRTTFIRQLVYSKQIDLFYITDYYSRYFDSYQISSYYIYDPCIWITAAPDHMRNIEIMLGIFSTSCWLLILLLLLITSLVAHLTSVQNREPSLDTFSTSFLAVYAAGLRISQGNLRVKSGKLKLFLGFYFLYAMHLCYHFDGKYSSILTKAHFQSGMTLEQVADSLDIKPVLRQDSIKLFQEFNISLATKLALKTRPLHELPVPHNRVQYVEEHKNTCITIYESVFQLYKSNGVKVLGNRFLQPQTDSFGFRKGNPLFERINRIIQRIFEGGFNAKWLDNMKNGSLLASNGPKAVALNHKHLEGAYLLLLFGSVLAFIVFVCEVLREKYKTSARLRTVNRACSKR